MSGSKIILDSNIIIALFAKDELVADKIRENQVYVPAIVLGELYYGAYKSAKKDKNVLHIDDFGIEAHILDINKQTSKHYGEVKSYLAKNGTPIPENDIWIIALAKQYGMTVATRDKHFQHVSELISTVSW